MAKYESRGEAIRSLRKDAGLSQEELANKLHTTKQTIYKYEAGIVTNIPSDKIEEMSQIFHVSPAVIMGWDEDVAVPPSPVYEAAAGEGRVGDGFPVDEVAVKLDADQVLVRVKGDSMEPTLFSGDLVVISAQSIIDHPRQIALVKVNGDEATLKRVEIKDNGILLIGDNTSEYSPHFFTTEEVEQMPITIEGVVVRLIRDML